MLNFLSLLGEDKLSSRMKVQEVHFSFFKFSIIVNIYLISSTGLTRHFPGSDYSGRRCEGFWFREKNSALILSTDKERISEISQTIKWLNILAWFC